MECFCQVRAIQLVDTNGRRIQGASISLSTGNLIQGNIKLAGKANSILSTNGEYQNIGGLKMQNGEWTTKLTQAPLLIKLPANTYSGIYKAPMSWKLDMEE